MAETISISGDLSSVNLKIVYDKLPDNPNPSVLASTNSPSITITISASDSYISENKVNNSKPFFKGFSGHNAGYFNSTSAANSANLLPIQDSQTSNNIGDKIADEANKMVDKAFRPGQKYQCANFVNHILEVQGVKLKTTKQAIDGLPSGESRASRFFGEDVGTIIRDKNQLKKGDLVAWYDTYKPAYKQKDNVITHVGIYAGNGRVIDRPTANKPVKERSIDSIGQFAAGVRPFAYNNLS